MSLVAVSEDSARTRNAQRWNYRCTRRNRSSYPRTHSIRAKPWRYNIITKVGGSIQIHFVNVSGSSSPPFHLMSAGSSQHPMILLANLISTTEGSMTATVEGCSAVRGKVMEKGSHREMEGTVQFAELGKEIGKEKDIENGTKQGSEGNDQSRPLAMFHRKPSPLFKHVHCNEHRLCFQHLRDDLQRPKNEPNLRYHSLFISSYFCLGCSLPYLTGL
ncbi:hypothetical protein I309_04739 [Cryptococcus deuterogattii LA55]|nr:hypothetical protein I309_04739 [Cryptococcus deuterogattii LA55]KIR89938.1 hypothetical protein I304_06184 [Cryptococcus deuterogattii CBS 10090]